MSFLSGAIWTVFGILVKDKFIIVPNCAGAIISLVQLIIAIIIKYVFPRKHENLKDDVSFINEEDGASINNPSYDLDKFIKAEIERGGIDLSGCHVLWESIGDT
eukprot:gene16021-19069_t